MGDFELVESAMSVARVPCRSLRSIKVTPNYVSAGRGVVAEHEHIGVVDEQGARQVETHPQVVIGSRSRTV